MADDLQDLAATVRPFTGEDDAAPHGRTRSGAPRAKAPPRRPPPRKTPDVRHYDQELLALAQLPAGLLQVVAIQTKRVEFAADARTVVIYAPGICTALDQIAQEHKPTAQFLDALLRMGPFGVLFTALAPMALQFAVNHGALQAGIMGTVSVEELLNIPMPIPDEQAGNGQVADAVNPG